jgi:hypothetical protein
MFFFLWFFLHLKKSKAIMKSQSSPSQGQHSISVSVVGGRLLLLFDVAHIILLDEMLDVRQHVVQVIESLLSILESGVAFVFLVLLHYPIFQGLNKKVQVNTN